jgi:hypothetical protein
VKGNTERKHYVCFLKQKKFSVNIYKVVLLKCGRGFSARDKFCIIQKNLPVARCKSLGNK